MLNRRTFIKSSAALSLFPLNAYSSLDRIAAKDDLISLTILHTNDVHSRIEAFPETAKKYAGLGGFTKRFSLINRIRSNAERVLLFDAGDIIQGTPYFNLFNGELEIKLMNELKYDAATIGNHDFDGGLECLKKMVNNANFNFISSNYNFSDTILKDRVLPYKVIEKDPLKIGVFGLGIYLDGLVPAHLYGNTNYNNPLYVAEEMTKKLKNDLKCDYVICLSHLGYQNSSADIHDEHIALNTKDLDLIIGGHTHTFMDQPVVVENKHKQQVVINQVGWAGINVGSLNIFFEKKSKKIKRKSHTVIEVK